MERDLRQVVARDVHISHHRVYVPAVVVAIPRCGIKVERIELGRVFVKNTSDAYGVPGECLSHVHGVFDG